MERLSRFLASTGQNAGFAAMLAVISFALGVAAQDPEPTQYGAVKGRVIDAEGRPVAQVLITASTGELRTVQSAPGASNEAGEFFIPRAGVGLNLLYTSKETEGYPSSIFAYYSGTTSVPCVLVEEGKTTSGVVIQLASKAGTISLDVRNTKTGVRSVEPLEPELRWPPAIRLCRRNIIIPVEYGVMSIARWNRLLADSINRAASS